MNTALDIALVSVIAVLVGALVVTIGWVRGAVLDRATAIGDADAEKLKSGELADARDAALVKASQLQTQNDELARRLAAADAQRAAAATKEASDVADSIASAPTAADALAALNRGLAPVSGELHTSAGVPAAGEAAPSATADHNDGGGAAVPPRVAPGDGATRG